MKQKVNPNKIPASRAEVNRAYQRGRDDAFDDIETFTGVLTMWILTQHYDFPSDDVPGFYKKFLSYCDDIRTGIKNFRDFADELHDKTGFEVIRDERGRKK